jgi:hypothetical protein
MKDICGELIRIIGIITLHRHERKPYKISDYHGNIHFRGDANYSFYNRHTSPQVTIIHLATEMSVLRISVTMMLSDLFIMNGEALYEVNYKP